MAEPSEAPPPPRRRILLRLFLEYVRISLCVVGGGYAIIVAADEAFGVTLEELESILQPEKYTGRAKEQTEDFLAECVAPVLERYKDVASDKPEINV